MDNGCNTSLHLVALCLSYNFCSEPPRQVDNSVSYTYLSSFVLRPFVSRAHTQKASKKVEFLSNFPKRASPALHLGHSLFLRLLHTSNFDYPGLFRFANDGDPGSSFFFPSLCFRYCFMLPHLFICFRLNEKSERHSGESTYTFWFI